MRLLAEESERKIYEKIIIHLFICFLMLGMVVGCGNNKVEQQEISKNQIEETIVGEDNSKLINELDIAEFWELYSEKDGAKIWKATQ